MALLIIIDRASDSLSTKVSVNSCYLALFLYFSQNDFVSFHQLKFRIDLSRYVLFPSRG